MRHPYTVWDLEEVERLHWVYPTGTKESIMASFPNRPWGLIKAKATKLHLRLSRVCYKGDLSILLNGANSSFYWLGFLCADANFSEHSVSLELSKKDSVHLHLFCDYVGVPQTSVYERSRRVFNSQHSTLCAQVTQKAVVTKLRHTYSICSNKTKTPVDVSSLTDLQLFCFFIGFVDGDGSICFRKSGSIITSIEVDKSWFPVIQEFERLLIRLGITTTAKALLYTRRDTNQTFSRWQTSSRPVFYSLRQRALDLGLPLMQRKWFPQSSPPSLL